MVAVTDIGGYLVTNDVPPQISEASAAYGSYEYK